MLDVIGDWPSPDHTARTRRREVRMGLSVIAAATLLASALLARQISLVSGRQHAENLVQLGVLRRVSSDGPPATWLSWSDLLRWETWAIWLLGVAAATAVLLLHRWYARGR